jgi:phosphate transport system substrate-binding protein
MKRIRTIIWVGLGVSFVTICCVGVGCATRPKPSAGSTGSAGKAGGTASGVKLEGQGSTFVQPMMKTWTSAYAKETGTKPINYQGNGSGVGIKTMTQREADFGATDAPMNKEELTKAHEAGGDVVHIPLVMGAVVAAYNLPDVTEPLRFTGPVLADIYLGKIKKWNDPALTALNPQANLKDIDIVVVRRADSSGTTHIWTEYLAKVSPEWKEKVGVGKSVNWPVGVGAQHTDGVAGVIERTKGSIGYVEVQYALGSKNTHFGSVKNEAGEFILPSLESVTAAANSLANIPDDLCYSLTNAPGKESYPICGTTWAVMYEKQPEDKAKPLHDFLWWVVHDGQDMTKTLNYAPLPKRLIELVEKKLDRIQSEAAGAH